MADGSAIAVDGEVARDIEMARNAGLSRCMLPRTLSYRHSEMQRKDGNAQRARRRFNPSTRSCSLKVRCERGGNST